MSKEIFRCTECNYTMDRESVRCPICGETMTLDVDTSFNKDSPYYCIEGNIEKEEQHG